MQSAEQSGRLCYWVDKCMLLVMFFDFADDSTLSLPYTSAGVDLCAIVFYP